MKTTFGPEGVQATRQTNRRVCANVALEYLTIVPNLFDDLVSPVFTQSKFLNLAPFNAEHTQNFRIIGILHAVYIRGCNS